MTTFAKMFVCPLGLLLMTFCAKQFIHLDTKHLTCKDDRQFFATIPVTKTMSSSRPELYKIRHPGCCEVETNFINKYCEDIKKHPGLIDDYLKSSLRDNHYLMNPTVIGLANDEIAKKLSQSKDKPTIVRPVLLGREVHFRIFLWRNPGRLENVNDTLEDKIILNDGGVACYRFFQGQCIVYRCDSSRLPRIVDLRNHLKKTRYPTFFVKNFKNNTINYLRHEFEYSIQLPYFEEKNDNTGKYYLETYQQQIKKGVEYYDPQFDTLNHATHDYMFSGDVIPSVYAVSHRVHTAKIKVKLEPTTSTVRLPTELVTTPSPVVKSRINSNSIYQTTTRPRLFFPQQFGSKYNSESGETLPRPYIFELMYEDRK